MSVIKNYYVTLPNKRPELMVGGEGEGVASWTCYPQEAVLLQWDAKMAYKCHVVKCHLLLKFFLAQHFTQSSYKTILIYDNLTPN